MGDPNRKETELSPDFVQIDATEQGLSRRDLLKRAGAAGSATIAIPAGIREPNRKPRKQRQPVPHPRGCVRLSVLHSGRGRNDERGC